MSALVASFSRLLHRHPDRHLIHLPADRLSLTVDDVWRAHLAQGEALRSCGLQPGQLLLMAVGNRPLAVALFLAARRLDLAVVMVDAGATAAEIRDLCDRFGVAALAVPVEHATGLGELRATLGHGVALVSRQGPTPTTYPGVALFKLTSGSTGQPKATRTTEPQLVIDSEQLITGMGIGADDTQITVIPLSHAYGVSVILVPLLLQGTPIVLRESFVPPQLPADARRYGARTFPGVPFMFDYFLANPPSDGWPGTLTTLISAGARLSPDTVRQFHRTYGIKIHSFYGASEAGGISFDASDEPEPADTVGRPLPGVTITLRPDDEAPPGSGRVHVGAGGVASGYVGETADEFSDGGFLTGDFGMFDSGGRLVLTGRASSFINVAGNKVSPAEVEDVLRQMPGVRDVRVLAAADPRRGEQVAACIVADRREEQLTTLAVRKFCSARLASYKIPRLVVFLDALPLTARGKVDRRALDEALRAAIAGFPEQLC